MSVQRSGSVAAFPTASSVYLGIYGSSDHPRVRARSHPHVKNKGYELMSESALAMFTHCGADSEVVLLLAFYHLLLKRPR